MSALEHASGVIRALQTSMLLLLVTLRVCLHERRNKLIPVWDFNPACSHEVSFWLHFKTTQYFISGSVYMIFHHPKWNFISFKWPIWNPYLQWVLNTHAHYTQYSASLRLFISFRVNSVYMKISCRFKISFRTK